MSACPPQLCELDGCGGLKASLGLFLGGLVMSEKEEVVDVVKVC